MSRPSPRAAHLAVLALLTVGPATGVATAGETARRLAPERLVAAGEAGTPFRRPGGRVAASLDSGGFGLFEAASRPHGVRRATSEPASLLLDRLERALGRRGAMPSLHPAAMPGLDDGPVRPPERPRPHALGDRLVLSLDDGLGADVFQSWEGGLSVSGGRSGPADWVAVRFPSQALAVAPPFRVTDVVLGLDDLFGRVTWPTVGVTVEDPAQPLLPGVGLGPGNSVSDHDGAAALPAAPAGSPRPTDVARVAVGLPDVDVVPAWLADGSFDDAFDRADEALDNPNSSWLECQGGLCGGFSSLRVAGFAPPGAPDGAVVRTASGTPVLGIRFQEADVFDLRPARDLDLRVRAQLDLADAAASRAGLALRAMAPDALYRVEYVKATNQVEVVAATPGGDVVVDAFAVGAPTAQPLLEVDVLGATPAVTLVVRVDGVEVGTAVDATWRFTGTLSGLSASDPAGAGEAWSSFEVERRPDVFALVAFPAGEEAALAVDLSDAAVISASTLLSDDGATFWPRPAGSGCFNPGNAFVQLEVEEVTDQSLLFENEAHVVRVDVDCPTCRVGVAACADNLALTERLRPTPTVGESHDVRVSWWNEHLSDGDTLLFRASVWDAPCDSASGSLVASGGVVVGTDPGQLGTGPVLREAAVLTFTPASAGPHCVVIEELHDLNGDCCGDGFEDVPLGEPGCPGACVATGATDSNPSTRILLRDVTFAATCAPAAASNLAGDSLRVTRPAGDPVVTTVEWALVDGDLFPQRYNVHVIDGDRFGGTACFSAGAPVLDVVVGETSRSYDLPAGGVGKVLWLKVFETDGCPAGASLPDDSC